MTQQSFPTPSDFQYFVDAVDKLLNFEGQQRLLRHYGAFTEEEIKEFPNPKFIRVFSWLKQYTMENNENE